RRGDRPPSARPGVGRDRSMLNANTLRRLETQHEAIPLLLAGAAPEAVDSRPASGKWSARENLAHVARHHAVFRARLHRILEEDEPGLDRYSAEEDPEWPAWSGLPVEEILERIRSLRGKIVALVRGMSDAQAERGGIHPRLGRMSVTGWTEFFLLHEAHHLYTAMLRLGDARVSGICPGPHPPPRPRRLNKQEGRTPCSEWLCSSRWRRRPRRPRPTKRPTVSSRESSE